MSGGKTATPINTKLSGVLDSSAGQVMLVFLRGAVHVPRAAGHKRHLFTKVAHAPTGDMLHRRKMKLYEVIGTKGVIRFFFASGGA